MEAVIAILKNILKNTVVAIVLGVILGLISIVHHILVYATGQTLLKEDA